MVWEKVLTSHGQVYLMINNGFGWSGEIPLINSNGAFDDITPTLAQLINGTIILVWSRGAPGSGGCFQGNLYSLYAESYTNGKWSNPTTLTQGLGDDITPAITRLQDGRIMLAWTRCTSTNGRGDIYYKLYNGTWGPENLLVGSSTNEEKLPGITQAVDGRVWVVYSANTASGNVNQLWDVIWNGSTWTAPTVFTNTTADDDWATIAQDRNKTIWVFWARNLPNGTLNGQPIYQYDLFYKNSTNNGLSWSLEKTIAPNINSDDRQPFVIQTSTERLWMVYSSNQRLGNPYKTFNLYIITSDTVKIHDVAINTITSPAPARRTGEMVTFQVTSSNLGDFVESSQVRFYLNVTLLGTSAVTINVGGTVVSTFSWNSSGQKPARIPIRATIDPVTADVNTQNNSLNSTFLLVPRGDVNRDGTVNILDVGVITGRFLSTIGSPNYLADADLDHNGVINILDVGICTADFGKKVT